MMKKYVTHYLVAASVAAAALTAAQPAIAQPAACGYYQPGLLAFVTRTRPAPCVYQGDYIAKQGPTYDGPAVIAPQPTYAPSRTVNYVHGEYHRQAVVAPPVVRRTVVRRSARRVVNVQNELPPSKGKGKVEIVRAKAEVRIYSPQRMDIRLYRN